MDDVLDNTPKLFQRTSLGLTPFYLLIVVEGEADECKYFEKFQTDKFGNVINPRLQIEVVPPPQGVVGDLSERMINVADELSKKRNVIEGDSIWLVFDTEINQKSKEELESVANEIERHNWRYAMSNPCFEVWFYYHFFDYIPDEQTLNLTASHELKKCMQTWIKGGFDIRKYNPALKTAIVNARKAMQECVSAKVPGFFCTQVVSLAECILPYVRDYLDDRVSQDEKLTVTGLQERIMVYPQAAKKGLLNV